MQPSLFNVRVPLPDRDDVFLMNTFTDAQIIVSREVVSLLDALESQSDLGAAVLDEETQDALDTLAENGFVVADRAPRPRDYRPAVLRSQPAPRSAARRATLCNRVADHLGADAALYRQRQGVSR